MSNTILRVMMNANEIVKTTADNCKIKRHIIKLSGKKESISFSKIGILIGGDKAQDGHTRIISIKGNYQRDSNRASLVLSIGSNLGEE